MKLARNIVKEILDHGLADSTWRDKFPEAYEELVRFRKDMERSVSNKIKEALGL